MPIGPSWPSCMSASRRRSRWPKTANPSLVSTLWPITPAHWAGRPSVSSSSMRTSGMSGTHGRTSGSASNACWPRSPWTMSGLVLGLEMSRLLEVLQGLAPPVGGLRHLRRPAGRPGRDLRPVRSQRQALARPERPDLGTGAPYDPQPPGPRQTEQGPPGRIDHQRADRVREDAGRRPGAGPGRAGPGRRPTDLREVRRTGHRSRRHGVPEAESLPARHPPPRRAESGEP